MSTSPPQALRLLVRTLAQTDAIFVPVRDPYNPSWRAVWARRQEFAVRGVESLPVAGETDAERKARERGRKVLVSAGLIRAFRGTTAGSKVSHVKLTPRGDAIARALCGLDGMRQAIGLLKRMNKLRDDPGATSPGACSGQIDSRPWLAETMFTPGRVGWDGTNRDAELNAVTDSMLCGCSRRLVESNSSSLKHVYWRLTQSGLRVATGAAKIHLVEDSPDAEQWANDLYWESHNTAVLALRNSEIDCRDLGQIPLPVSMNTKGQSNEQG